MSVDAVDRDTPGVTSRTAGPVVLDVALSLVLLLSVGSGIFLRVLLTGLGPALGSSPTADDYRLAAVVAGTHAAVLLVLGSLVVLVFRRARWLHAITITGSALLLILSLQTWRAASDLPSSGTLYPSNVVADGITFAAAAPTSWPLLALAGCALVRAWWCRAPR